MRPLRLYGLNRLQVLLKPPGFLDDEQTRVARLLHWGIIASGALVVFDALILLFFAPETLPTFWMNGLMLALLLICYQLTRRGKLHTAGTLMCGSLWLLTTLYLLQSGGTLSPAFGLLSLVVISAAVVLGTRGTVIFGTLCAFTALFLYFGGANGWLVNLEPAPTPSRLFASQFGILIGLAVFMVFSARSVQQALTRARQSESYLIDRNRQLEQEVTDRKQTEIALKNSEERFLKAFHANPTALMISTLDTGYFVDVNEECLKILERTRDEVVGHSGFELEMWLDEADRAAAIKKLQDEGFIRDDEVQFRTKSGHFRDTLVSREIIDLAGKPHILSLIQDITERKKAEERFFKAFHANPTSITITTLDDGRFIDVNEACLKLLGYTREELIGHTAVGLPTWGNVNDRALALQVLEEKGTLRDLETQFRNKSGELRNALVSLEIIDLSGKPHLLGMVQDITERKEASQRLHESEEALRQLSDSTFEGIAFTHDGKIILVNKQLAEMLGYGQEELVGLPVMTTVAPESHELVLEHIRSGYEQPYDHLALRKDGSTFPVEVHGRNIIHEGRLVRVTAIRDLTQRKQVEQQQLELALQTERMDAFKEFLSKISHDLKTPLSVINTSLYLLERTDDPERQRSKIGAIREQTGLVETFIQDLLTLSRLDHVPEFTLAPLDVNQILNNVERKLQSAAEHKNLTLRFTLDTSIPPVMADSTELYHALFNLVENAVHYTKDGGLVTVTTGSGSDGVAVDVRDTGIGIPAEALPHIFERFYRADEARQVRGTGTGLGLAIVHRIIEIHHGQIGVESTPGVGTSFHLCLPPAP